MCSCHVSDRWDSIGISSCRYSSIKVISSVEAEYISSEYQRITEHVAKGPEGFAEAKSAMREEPLNEFCALKRNLTSNFAEMLS